MSGKCRFLSADNERQMRERRNGDARQSREKAETEQRKNKERTRKEQGNAARHIAKHCKRDNTERTEKECRKNVAF